MPTNPVVFVCGATGLQGSAVARQLLALDWTVHSTVRNPGSPVAQELQQAGAKLTPGDWDDEQALRAALTGCTKLFLLLVRDFHDLNLEVSRAERILSLARAAGITQVVYSSSVAADDPSQITTIPPDSFLHKGLVAKHTIEVAVAAASFESHTILRPCNLMANWLPPKARWFEGLLDKHQWVLGMKPSVQWPLIDDQDVAKFAIAAFKDPKRFNGVGVALAGDLKTPDEITAALTAASGQTISTLYLSDEEVEARRTTDIRILSHIAMEGLMKAFSKDQAKISEWGIPMGSFEAFLKREKKAVAESYVALE